MAFFKDLETGQRGYLQAQHTFGRMAEKVETHINRPSISKIHAVIEWQQYHWYLRDLSRNGCWLNGQKLMPNDSYQLSLGDRLQFADSLHQGLKICDLSAPCNLLIPLNEQGQQIEADAVSLSQYHLLPNEDAPEAALFYCVEQGAWCLESNHPAGYREPIIKPLEHGVQVSCANRLWQLFINQAQPITQLLDPSLPHTDNVEFIFDLSLDEESIQLQINAAGKMLDLDIRSHHEVAMQLARYKARDHRLGLSEMDQGWIYAEQLAADLGVAVSHLNILIFRARKQFNQFLLEHLEVQQLFQRRGGRIRLGASQFKVVKSGRLECELKRASVA